MLGARMSIKRISQAIDKAGGQTAVAEKLSKLTGRRVRQSKVSMWLHRRRIPPEWVIPLETVLDCPLKRHDIRPDLYPRDSVAA